MSVLLVLGSNGAALRNGEVEPNGGDVLDRVTTLDVRLELIPGRAGTLTEALCVEISRDASQGTTADLVPLKYQASDGRVEKNMFMLEVLLIDDVRRGRPALISKLICKDAFVSNCTTFCDDAGSPVQTVAFQCSRFNFHNAITGQDVSPEDVEVPGFNDEQDEDEGD